VLSLLGELLLCVLSELMDSLRLDAVLRLDALELLLLADDKLDAELLLLDWLLRLDCDWLL